MLIKTSNTTQVTGLLIFALARILSSSFSIELTQTTIPKQYNYLSSFLISIPDTEFLVNNRLAGMEPYSRISDSPTKGIMHLTFSINPSMAINGPYKDRCAFHSENHRQKKDRKVERMKSKLFAVLFCFTLILLITNSDGFSGTFSGKRGVFRNGEAFS